VLTGSLVPLRSFAAKSLPCDGCELTIQYGGVLIDIGCMTYLDNADLEGQRIGGRHGELSCRRRTEDFGCRTSNA
jgi:hypothetical protein